MDDNASVATSRQLDMEGRRPMDSTKVSEQHTREAVIVATVEELDRHVRALERLKLVLPGRRKSIAKDLEEFKENNRLQLASPRSSQYGNPNH